MTNTELLLLNLRYNSPIVHELFSYQICRNNPKGIYQVVGIKFELEASLTCTYVDEWEVSGSAVNPGRVGFLHPDRGAATSDVTC